MKWRAAAVLASTVVAILVGCSGGHPKPPPPTVPSVTTAPPTTMADFSSVSLAGVAGKTTLTISLTPGRATINGTVLDDTGAPVPGADVHIERIVGAATAAGDFAVAADGTFSVNGLLGGVYSVRAWRPPDLADPTAQVFFIGTTDTRSVNLQLQRFTGEDVASSIAPDPPIITEPAQLVVQVIGSTVGADGVVRRQGKPNVTVQLYGAGQWAIASPPTQTTDAGGLVRWDMTCQALGSQPLSVLVNGTDAFPLTIQGCIPVPPTTTSSSTTSTTPGHPTTTVKKSKH